MKKKLTLLFIALVVMAVLPMLAVKTPAPDSKEEKKLDITQICVEAVAYEMPPSFEQEALKAQCIACYTNFVRKGTISRMTDKEMQEKWGEHYEEYKAAIVKAVKAVAGKALTDRDGKPIDAAYHAISGGQTEDAKYIFGGEDSHLKPVSSGGDVNAPDYLSQKEITAGELQKILLAQNITLKGDAGTWLSDVQKTPSGTVLTVKFGGHALSGVKLREWLGLRSAVFDVAYDGKKFVFTVHGYGHGVGMSQYGAEYMAQQGASYQEILLHYYTDCQITPLSPA